MLVYYTEIIKNSRKEIVIVIMLQSRKVRQGAEEQRKAEGRKPILSLCSNVIKKPIP